MRSGQAYLDIVWQQFRKNRAALISLWIVIALFLVAIFAPLLASDQPLVFSQDGKLVFPWFISLFNADSVVDFVFNVALLVFFPWAAVAFALNRSWRNRDVPGRVRFLRLAGLSFTVLAVSCAVAVPLSPSNKYFDRNFKKEHLEGKGNGFFVLIPFGPTEQDLDIIFKPPMHRKTEASTTYRDNELHYLGTDNSGRDALSRLIYGTRISMTIGFIAVSIYLTIGIIIGATAGFMGGFVDVLISRIIEVVMLFPSFFLILTLVALIGPSIYIIMFVIGLTGWPTIARLIRGEYLRQRSSEYVTAARALGAGVPRIMFRHILPNALSPAMVAAPFGVAGAILTEGALSVLGFGVRPPTPSWGSLLNLAVSNYSLWWLIVFPGLAIFVTVSAFNLVGNGLRDAMDPRLRV